jgi:transglutaminase-like putative cysteine protease
MLKLSAPQASLRQISSRSGQQLLIAIPLSILLFFIFPRINPLWNVPFVTQGRTGFSDRMSPGSIGMLFNDDSVAMQITFNKKPIFDGYWRGLILSYYTGISWYPSWYNYSSFVSLQELNANDAADYEIILEPDQKKWLFYEGYPVAGRPDLVFSPNHGLIRQNQEIIAQRFAYSLTARSAPYHTLTAAEYAEATQLPRNINPRLNAWAKNQFANSHQNIQAFITFLQDYIHQQAFWYTLTPPVLNDNRKQMDSFWFDTQKGYCEYYASAVTYILRAAGIPARVVIGYHGGQWNPITHAITIRQYDAHAWLEYWVNGIGWQQLDPTSFIAFERIDRTIRSRQFDLLYQQDYLSISAMPWQQEISLFLDSARFFAERWFLFYNEDTQQNLLQRVGLGQWKPGQLFQASVACVILFFILLGLSYYWWQRRALDALLFEYHLLQKEFRRFNISTHPSATLKKQCNSLINKAPDLAPILSTFIDRYEQLRLKQSQNDSKENKKETIALFKMLRNKLRRTKKI